MKIRSLFSSAIAIVAICLVPVSLHAQSTDTPSDADINSAIASLRADIHADKVSIIRSVMHFTPQESEAFWPIYRQYSADMDNVNDKRVSLVRDYAHNYRSMTDADAKALVSKGIDFEQQRLNVKKKYVKEFSKKLSGQTVAEFFQLEHRMDMIVDLELAAQLPSLFEKESLQ